MGLAVVGLGLVCFKLWRVTPDRISPERYKQILDEVMSVDFPFRSLTPDVLGSNLAYIHEAEQGRGLFLLNLKTGERTAIETTNEVTQINGWSPDNRYLAFIQSPRDLPEVRVYFGNDYQREEWITILDTQNNSFKRATQATNVLESRFYWLSTKKYVFVSRPLAGKYAEVILGDLDNGRNDGVFNYQRLMDSLIVLSDRTAAYAEGGDIYTIDIEASKLAKAGGSEHPYRTMKVSQFESYRFSPLRWLRYSPENGRYLFCATPADSNWRYLYDFDPKTKEPTQLTKEDTYNGQWLQRDSGFVYVGNTNNCFYLAVRPKEPGGWTNLFLNGGVVSYIVGPSGDSLYVVSAQGVEPAGIWEYDLKKRALRRLVDAIKAPFVASRIVEPQEFKEASADGVQIPCFLYAPVRTARHSEEANLWARFRPKTKYPLAIFLPPVTAASKRAFDARAQLLPNLGFYFVAVNYRGCEGYGKGYAGLQNTAEAAEDVLRVYRKLINELDIDKHNVFLTSSSDGSEVAYDLMAKSPKLWRAVTLENPTDVDCDRFDPSELPPVFFAIGDQDRALSLLQKFESWGASNRVEIQSVIYTNSGHITYVTSQRKDKLSRVSAFMLKHLK